SPLKHTVSRQLTPCQEPPHTAATARTAFPTPNTPEASKATPSSSPLAEKAATPKFLAEKAATPCVL
ncbi:hypothetical protein M9458_028678, partial [Cirrhinus mrigala]